MLFMIVLKKSLFFFLIIIQSSDFMCLLEVEWFLEKVCCAAGSELQNILSVVLPM